ncbi:MAG: response regulator [Candidatus Kerfeldbacteria bacterium]|nr:response regulator [Candidatus Kerfeldbacteria bacterium]
MNNHKSVLLVEDEPSIVAMYQLKFIASGFEFYATADIHEGFNLAKHHQPSVILLDIKLGDQSGMDLLKMLKAEDSTKAIPVLMFSNAYQKEYEKAAIELGAKEFVLKTKVLPDETIAIVNKYL